MNVVLVRRLLGGCRRWRLHTLLMFVHNANRLCAARFRLGRKLRGRRGGRRCQKTSSYKNTRHRRFQEVQYCINYSLATSSSSHLLTIAPSSPLGATMTKHTIVALDSWVSPPPLNFDNEFIGYPSTSSAELPEHMKDATIVITSAIRVTREGIENAPHLKLIACNG